MIQIEVKRLTAYFWYVYDQVFLSLREAVGANPKPKDPKTLRVSVS